MQKLENIFVILNLNFSNVLQLIFCLYMNDTFCENRQTSPGHPIKTILRFNRIIITCDKTIGYKAVNIRVSKFDQLFRVSPARTPCVQVTADRR